MAARFLPARLFSFAARRAPAAALLAALFLTACATDPSTIKRTPRPPDAEDARVIAADQETAGETKEEEGGEATEGAPENAPENAPGEEAETKPEGDAPVESGSDD